MQGSGTLLNLTSRLKELVNQEFQQQRLDMASLMAILYALGQAQNEGELIYTAKTFSDRFPAIKTFLDEINAKQKKTMEKSMSEIIQKMVAKDPLKAAQIAKDTMSPGMTYEKLAEKYPEIKNL